MALKKKRMALTYSIVAIMLGVLTYFGFVAKWIMVTTSVNGKAVQKEFGFKTFFDFFVKGQKTEYFNPTLLKVSFAVMVVLLVCLAVYIVATIISLFVEHKVVLKIAKISRLLTYLLAIAFILTFLAGGFMCYKAEPVMGIKLPSQFVMPYIGAYWVVMASMLSAWFGKRALKQKKVKSEQPQTEETK